MRGGRKKRPFYRIVAASALAPRDGRFLENVGTYNPLGANGTDVTLDVERVLYWLNSGAQPTRTTRNLLSAEGVLLRFDLEKRGAKAEEVEAAVASHLEARNKRESEKAGKTEERARKKAEEEAKAAKAAEKEAQKAEEKAKAAEEAPVEEVKEEPAAE